MTHTGAWTDHDGPLPIMAGTVIRLQVDRLPGTGTPSSRVATSKSHIKIPKPSSANRYIPALTNLTSTELEHFRPAA